MIHKIYMALMLLYIIVLMLHNISLMRKLGKERHAAKDDEKGDENDDIVGKSGFVQSHLEPESDKGNKSEQSEQKADIFAGDKSSARVPNEELDELFSQEQEQFDIDVKLEYENEQSLDLEDESEEVKGASQNALATGVSFEELCTMVQTVKSDETSSPQVRISAGNTLLEIRNTDMFERLVSESTKSKDRVNRLIEDSLTAFYSRHKPTQTKKSPPIPEDFDISNYV